MAKSNRKGANSRAKNKSSKSKNNHGDVPATTGVGTIERIAAASETNGHSEGRTAIGPLEKLADIEARAEVAVESESRTELSAVSELLRDWVF